MNNYSGYLKEIKDPRDYPISMAYDESADFVLPESYRTSFQPPYAKQVAGNCVAQSLANILEVAYYKQIGEHRDFSVGFIYGNRKPTQFQGEGMYGSSACGNLCEDGDVFASLFENPGSAPSIIQKVMAVKEELLPFTFKPSHYIRTNSLDEVKKFIFKYDLPVMAFTDVRHFYWGTGGHAMAMYGWDGDDVVMQNSWGENSPVKTVVLNKDKIDDFWIIIPWQIPEFTDLLKTHWAYEEVKTCALDRVALGYPDNTFKPDSQMTRAEFCVLLQRAEKLRFFEKEKDK
ncbi:S-layer homology domain-containing protein [Massilibacteroides sp.]|uniref:S-layer homology domain-containing protein n=1 Tax=Massilibacteroides sp. TaxID=2034766 RepID=UPI00260450CC|nr:S-layer homology domain-containing protein [Massilibacteroides sp.]MDD4516340.1 S-layer homology domain-containing protein [Massilibacteroides sp.]